MRRSLVVALLSLVALVAVGVVIAAGSSEPARPPWVDGDGRLKKENVPASFEVAGPDGNPVVCANGQRLRVVTSELFGPPPPPNVLRVQQRTGKEDLVWRCGKGANPHLDPRLVPESQDPLRSND